MATEEKVYDIDDGEIKVLVDFEIRKFVVMTKKTGQMFWDEINEKKVQETPKMIIETVSVSDMHCKYCGGTNVRKEMLGNRMYCSDCKGFYEV